MCCFELLNCYIYEASKKWRNRQMKREQVLALYDAYADSVYRVALGYLRSPHDAEDAVQAVFCKLMEQKLSVYPGRERAFLTKLTVNHCKNQLAAAKRFVPDALDDLILPAEPADRTLYRAVMELPEKYRVVIVLHCMEGYRNRRIPAYHYFCRFHAPAQGAKNVGRTTREGLTWNKALSALQIPFACRKAAEHASAHRSPSGQKNRRLLCKTIPKNIYRGWRWPRSSLRRR